MTTQRPLQREESRPIPLVCSVIGGAVPIHVYKTDAARLARIKRQDPTKKEKYRREDLNLHDLAVTGF
jgi:hypothetical protein